MFYFILFYFRFRCYSEVMLGLFVGKHFCFSYFMYCVCAMSDALK